MKYQQFQLILHIPGIAWATKWSGGGGLLKSTDYGETWNLQSGFTGISMWGVMFNLQMEILLLPIVIPLVQEVGEQQMAVQPGHQYQFLHQVIRYVSVDSMTQFAAQSSGFYKLEPHGLYLLN